MARQSENKLNVSKWLPIYLALLFLIIPARLLLALIVSVVIHEACHLVAIKLYSINVRSITVGLNGAKIITNPMEMHQELVCAAAGPVGSLLVVMLDRYFPLLAVCSLFHGIFNLIPLGSMDGARIIRCILQKIFDHKKAKRVQAGIERIFMISISFLVIYLCVINRLGIICFVVLLILIIRKIPCKLSGKRVQ